MDRATVRYVDITIRQPDEQLHPMQRFIRDEDVVSYEELVAWTLRPTQGEQLSLFYVEADLEPYEAAIRSVESIDRYRLITLDDTAAHVWVVEQLRPEFLSFAAPFADSDVIVLPPVRFDDGAAMRMTLVGPGADIQTALDAVGETSRLTVHRVGGFDPRHGDPMGELTDRQREAVQIALDCGYYAVPREADLAEVADALDCTQSTASVLLRRAERTVLDRIVQR